MGNRKSIFSKPDVVRALAIAEEAGLEINGFSLSPDGTIHISTGRHAKQAALQLTYEPDENELVDDDEELRL